MRNPDRGEVWLVDLGLAAKTRPCLVLSIPATEDTDRALVTMISNTTSVRGSQRGVLCLCVGLSRHMKNSESQT